MPLIDDTGFITDSWVRVSEENTLFADQVIVPFARFEEAAIVNVKKIGIHISNTVRPAELAQHFAKLGLISIDFPNFADGRGFSIARSLRKYGFMGELRAFGPLIADQYAYARSCGFDTIEVPEELAARQPEAQWKDAGKSLSLSYQRGYVHGENILNQRITHEAVSKAGAV